MWWTGRTQSALFKVTSSLYPKWFVYLWIRQHLPEFQEIAAGKATTMGHIQRHHLTAAQVLVPPDNTLLAMNRIMAPLFERIISNNLESRTLAAIRDALLPKLLSGEIRVQEAENLVEVKNDKPQALGLWAI